MSNSIINVLVLYLCTNNDLEIGIILNQRITAGIKQFQLRLHAKQI